MNLSRRGFLRKVLEITGIGTGAIIASKLPELPMEQEGLVGEALDTLYVADAGCASSCSVAMKDDTVILMRYWYLKDLLGSAALDAYPYAQQQAMWQEYYDLVDMLGALGMEPVVRIVDGQTVIVNSGVPTGKYEGQRWPHRG